MRRRRLVLALGAVALVAGAAPGSAPAAEGPSLAIATGAQFPKRSVVVTLPSDQAVDPAAVHLTEDGREVRNVQITPAGRAGGNAFGVVLAIDASGSMKGRPIADAMAAARAFAAERPANQELGVVFFSRDSRVVLRPTTDGPKIQQALAVPPVLSRGTGLYDATASSLRLLRESRVRVGSIVLLSDGADVGSRLTGAAVVRAAGRAHVRIFSVGLRSRSFNRQALQGLAAPTGGTFAEASTSAQLEPIFSALSRRLAREYLVRYTSLAPMGRRVTVTAGIDGVRGTGTASYISPAIVLPGQRAHVVAEGFWSSAAVAAAVAAAIALGAGLVAFLLVRRRPASVRDRIAGFVPVEPGLEEALAEMTGAEPSPEGGGSRLSHSELWQRFVEDVDVSGLDIEPRALVRILAGVLAGFFLLGVLAGSVVLVALGFLCAYGGWFFVRFKAGRQRRAFDFSLADNLQVIASAMRAGHPFIGAMGVAAEDAGEPTRAEFRRVVHDERLGMPLEQAVSRVAERMRNEDFEYVGLVAALQRETGGNTAEVIDRVIETIRERAALRRMVKSLTAQGRLSGGVVTVLPIALALVLTAMMPGYFDAFLATTLGKMLFAVAGILILSGWLVIRRIVDIKV